MIVKRNLYLRIMALILVCAMMLSSCSVLEELLDESVLNENAPPLEENTTSAGTEEDTAAPEEYENAVHSSAKAGESATVTFTFEDVAGVDGAFTVKNEGVTVDKIEVKNKKGILCDIYDGSGDMKIFAYDNRAQLNTFTVTVYYTLSENANGTYIIEFDGETSDETGKELTKQKINIVITVESAACEHKDDNPTDHNCDACGEAMSECADNNRDHKCDMCGEVMSECADNNFDHMCDLCCKKLSECVDGNNDHNCDECNKKITACIDNDRNHWCDICGNGDGKCIDGDRDHYCDLCSKKISSCSDDDNDHYCAYCYAKLTYCEDLNCDHKCELCNVRLSTCIDGNGDFKCDICSESIYSSGFQYYMNENGVTCTITDMDVSKNTDIIIPEYIDGYMVTGIDDYAVSYYVTTISIPKTIMYISDWAFFSTIKLSDIYVDPNNSNYSSIEGVLYNKSADTLIKYPPLKSNTNFSIPNTVVIINDNAFESCKKLNYINISNSVTTIGSYAFIDCDGLLSITIPGSIQIISQGMLYECDSLKEIIISDGVKYIQGQAFADCRALEQIIIPKSVINIEMDNAYSPFYFAFNDSNLVEIIVDDNNPAYKSIDGNVYSKNGDTLVAYAPGKTEEIFYIPDGVKYIGDNAFSTSNVRKVYIAESVISIGIYAFSECKNLVEIAIPDSVTNIDDYVFYNCDSLTSVIIGNSVTSIGLSIFGHCDNLSNINVDVDNTIYYSEQNCIIEKSSRKLVVGCNNSVIPSNITSIGDSAFSNCDVLTSVTVPNSVTSIGNWAFSNCQSLTSINYDGSKVEWEQMSKGWSWDLNINNYTIYCTDGEITKE